MMILWLFLQSSAVWRSRLRKHFHTCLLCPMDVRGLANIANHVKIGIRPDRSTEHLNAYAQRQSDRRACPLRAEEDQDGTLQKRQRARAPGVADLGASRTAIASETCRA